MRLIYQRKASWVEVTESGIYFFKFAGILSVQITPEMAEPIAAPI